MERHFVKLEFDLERPDDSNQTLFLERISTSSGLDNETVVNILSNALYVEARDFVEKHNPDCACSALKYAKKFKAFCEYLYSEENPDDYLKNSIFKK